MVPPRPAAPRQPRAAGRGCPGPDGVAAAVRPRPGCCGPVGPVRRAYLLRSLARARRLARRPPGRRPRRPGPASSPPVAAAVGAASVHVAADFGPYGSPPRRRRRSPPSARCGRWSGPGRRTPSRPVGSRTRAGQPFQVFTPFYRAWLAHGWRAPAADAPADVAWLTAAASVTAWPDRASRSTVWRCPTVGERAALRRWESFRDSTLDDYATAPRPGRPRRDVVPVGGPAVGRDPSADDARRARATPRRTRRSARSWRGASSTPTSCRHEPRAAREYLRPEMAGCTRPAVGTPTWRSRRGPKDVPASRSSTPGCASCAPRAGCTTGCGWSWRPSSSRTCTWTGARRSRVHALAARRRPRLQPAQLAVGGRLGHRRGAVLPGVQPRPAGPEVRPGRGRTSAGTSPSCARVPGAAVHEPWDLPGGRCRRAIPSASSTTPSSDGRRWPASVRCATRPCGLAEAQLLGAPERLAARHGRRRGAAATSCRSVDGDEQHGAPDRPRRAPLCTVAGHPRAQSSPATPGSAVMIVTPIVPGVSRSPATRPSRTPRPTPAAYAPMLSGSCRLVTTWLIAVICRTAPTRAEQPSRGCAGRARR